ncbi:MAG: tyrosine--tRNA ligase [Candidatus Aenigmarchaeota archaeon]|nr:tyrosine--tRNA ligase [Candidatus Aenigmarchaeota archaeon]
MDLETRFELVKSVGEEIITEQELRELLGTNLHPIAYDGFECSGLAHLPFGVFRPLLLKDLIKAGVHFKLWLADSFAWINNKMGGDLNRIRKVGEYFIEVWKAAGVDEKKVEFLWASDAFSNKEYWKKVILIAKNTTMHRATRALTIMGRKEGEMQEVAQYFYPMMQTADIFHLDADICQLGLDQRRANMLARDVAEKMKWKKPVVVSHHMLMGLEGAKQPEGYEENKEMDVEISSKMSKSKPQTAIFVHDSQEEIKKKINSAFCPEKVIEGNPVLEYSKYLVFKKFKSMKIERDQKFGGNIEFDSYKELEETFRQGKLHPVDLKDAVAIYLDQMIEPIRKHFEKDKKARKLYEFVKKQEITR